MEHKLCTVVGIRDFRKTIFLRQVFSVCPPLLGPALLSRCAERKLPAQTSAIRLRSDSVMFLGDYSHQLTLPPPKK